MANNRFTGMMTGLDPQTARLVAAISGGPQNRNVSVQRNDPRLSNTIEADRVSRQQADMDQRHQSLGSIPKGLRQAAPIVAVLQSIASQMQRKGDNRKLDELYGQYQTKMDAQAQQEARAKEAAAMQAQEQAAIQRQQEVDDARVKHERDMEATAAEQAGKYGYDQQLAAATAPSKQEQAAGIMAQAQQLPPEQQEEFLIMNGMADIVKYRQGQASSSERKNQQAAFKQSLQDDIQWLLSDEQKGNLSGATGSFQGSDLYPTSFTPGGQAALDWQDRFNALQGKLTQENLSLLKGAMSEKELDFLRSLSTGGVNLRSGEDRIRKGLSQFQDGGPIEITSDEHYESLPSGAEYIDPENRKTYRKP